MAERSVQSITLSEAGPERPRPTSTAFINSQVREIFLFQVGILASLTVVATPNVPRNCASDKLERDVTVTR